MKYLTGMLLGHVHLAFVFLGSETSCINDFLISYNFCRASYTLNNLGIFKWPACLTCLGYFGCLQSFCIFTRLLAGSNSMYVHAAFWVASSFMAFTLSWIILTATILPSPSSSSVTAPTPMSFSSSWTGPQKVRVASNLRLWCSGRPDYVCE